MNNKAVVSVVVCPDYEQGLVDAAVHEAMNLAGIDAGFAGCESVLLKPNLLSARVPEDAVTTHPALIRCLSVIAKANGLRVAVGDSPPFAGENPSRLSKHIAKCGVQQVVDDLGVDFVRFEEDVLTVPHPHGKIYHSFQIAKAVMEADILINLPKLKTHGLTIMSGAIKNCFGCVPGVAKGVFHAQAGENREVFAQMLVDLLAVVRPKINIMDAVWAMEGEGPNAGKPKHVGLIMASDDPVALDAVACHIIGINPSSVDVIRLADEQGLGIGKLENIDVRGCRLEDVQVPKFKVSSGQNMWDGIPKPLRSLVRRSITATPSIMPDKCIKCGDCSRVCPVKAIIGNQALQIDLEKCIRCYCCHEVCNSSAIKLKRPVLGRLIKRTS